MSEATHTPIQEALDAQRETVKNIKPEEQQQAVQAALAKVSEHLSQKKKLNAQKRDRLLGVQIDRAEAATLAIEFGIAKDQAETILREHNGSLEDAVSYLLTTKPH